MSTARDPFDSKGNLHLGSFTRAVPTTNPRITVDFNAEQSAGIALDVAPYGSAGVNQRAGIKLGNFILTMDPSQNGGSDLGVVDQNGVIVNRFASGNAAGMGGGQFELYRANIPLILAPTGSFANNGVLTSGTANPLTYVNTYTWFPTGALFTASVAGWYWTVWSTTTAAVVYNNTWDGKSSPVAPVSAVPFVCTGPGAFTGPTVNAMYMQLPMAAAGVSSLYDLAAKFNQTNNAGAKVFSVRSQNLAGTLLFTATLTSLAEADMVMNLNCNGDAAHQTVYGLTNGSTGFVRQAMALFTEAYGSAFNIAFCISRATATDVVVVENFQVVTYR